MSRKGNDYYNWSDEFKGVLKKNYLSAEEIAEIVDKYQSSESPEERERLRDVIVLNHVKLVMSIANRYCGKYGTDIEDTFQNGIFGLLRAVDKFKDDKGARFSTYASIWIEQSIQRSIDPRKPIHVSNAYRHIVYKYIQLKKKYNGDEVKLRKALKAKNIGLTPNSLDNIVAILYNDKFFVGIDEKIGVGGERRSLEDVLPDRNAKDPEEIFFDKWQKEKLLEVMKKRLTEQEQSVIIWRYLSGSSLTYDEISKRMKIKRERIRQIEVKSIGKLKGAFAKPVSDIRKFFKEKITKDGKIKYNKKGLKDDI